MAKQVKSKDGKEAATFRLQPDLLKKLKYIALMENTTQTDLIEACVTDLITKWEKKNGPIPVK